MEIRKFAKFPCSNAAAGSNKGLARRAAGGLTVALRAIDGVRHEHVALALADLEVLNRAARAVVVVEQRWVFALVCDHAAVSALADQRIPPGSLRTRQICACNYGLRADAGASRGVEVIVGAVGLALLF